MGTIPRDLEGIVEVPNYKRGFALAILKLATCRAAALHAPGSSIVRVEFLSDRFLGNCQ